MIYDPICFSLGMIAGAFIFAIGIAVSVLCGGGGD